MLFPDTLRTPGKILLTVQTAWNCPANILTATLETMVCVISVTNSSVGIRLAVKNEASLFDAPSTSC